MQSPDNPTPQSTTITYMPLRISSSDQQWQKSVMQSFGVLFVVVSPNKLLNYGWIASALQYYNVYMTSL